MDAGAALRRRARAHRRFRRSGGPLLGRVQAGVVCAPPGWRASVACRALCCGGGPQWKASHGRGGVGGGQARGPLPWPASGRCGSSCWKAPQCTLRSLLRQGPGARALPMAAPWVPALTPAPFAWASPRSEEHNLQRPAAYRPGERSARFSPPSSEAMEAQPPLRVAAAHSPQNNSLEQACFLF